METASTSGQARPRFAAPLLTALRPYQWPKNAMVFAALAFSAGDAWHPSETSTWAPLLWRTVVFFAAWCLASSATYLINDLRDREVDQLHPRKRSRPIAAGLVSTRTAIVTAVILAAGALIITLPLDLGAGAIVAGYMAIMLLYSLGLKSVAILDVLILCTGVIARAVSGAVVINVSISPWLYVCGGFAAFFFASSKRWAEYRQLGSLAIEHRPSLAQYSGEILGQLVMISAASALISFALYTIESEHVPRNGSMALTIPFVAFGLFRYLLLLNGDRSTDAPDQIVFTDPQIVLAVFGFLATAMTVLVLK